MFVQSWSRTTSCTTPTVTTIHWTASSRPARSARGTSTSAPGRGGRWTATSSRRLTVRASNAALEVILFKNGCLFDFRIRWCLFFQACNALWTLLEWQSLVLGVMHVWRAGIMNDLVQKLIAIGEATDMKRYPPLVTCNSFCRLAGRQQNRSGAEADPHHQRDDFEGLEKSFIFATGTMEDLVWKLIDAIGALRHSICDC